MTEKDPTDDDYYDDAPVIGYTMETDYTVPVAVTEDRIEQMPEHEFFCRDCWDDADYDETDDRVARIPDQPVFGSEVKYPNCTRCGDLLTPPWEDVL